VIELKGKKVLVVGLGRSGQAAARVCADQGAIVTVTDRRGPEALASARANLAPGTTEELGGHREATFLAADLIVLSPGVPELPEIAAAPGGMSVVEVSSFQLETVDTFHPRVAVLLNVTPDHLDRYADFEGYAAAKARIFARQGPSDFAVLNTDDPVVRRCAEGIAAQQIMLSTTRVLDRGGWVEGDSLCVRLPGGDRERYPLHNPALTGRHNHENALAALLAARLVGATPSEARRALLEFRALAHRMELVADAAGVVYFDDSKGTNVGAVTAALSGFPRPVVLIAGGKDKGGDYAPLAAVFATVGRAVVLIGEAADRIADAFGKVVAPAQIVRAASLEEAVRKAAGLAQSGDAVILSPACSSFDMFRDYAHRAEVFRSAVKTVVGPEAML